MRGFSAFLDEEMGFPGGTLGGVSGKERTCHCRRHKSQFELWVGKIPWRRKWQPTQYSCLKNPMGRGAWRAAVHGVPKSRTCLKWLSTAQGSGSWNRTLKRSNHLKTCSTSFPGARSASFSPLNSPHGVLKVGSFSSIGFSLHRGRGQTPLWSLFSCWQMLLASANLYLTCKCQCVLDKPKYHIYL